MTDKYDQAKNEIQTSFDEKREQVLSLLNDGDITEEDYSNLIERLSDEENICYGEIDECYLEESR